MSKNTIVCRQILFTLLLTLISCFVNATESQNSQKKVSIGVFITSLYEFNINAGSYNADIWIWSESNIKDKFELDKVELGLLHGKYPLVI